MSSRKLNKFDDENQSNLVMYSKVKCDDENRLNLMFSKKNRYGGKRSNLVMKNMGTYTENRLNSVMNYTRTWEYLITFKFSLP